MPHEKIKGDDVENNTGHLTKRVSLAAGLRRLLPLLGAHLPPPRVWREKTVLLGPAWSTLPFLWEIEPACQGRVTNVGWGGLLAVTVDHSYMLDHSKGVFLF